MPTAAGGVWNAAAAAVEAEPGDHPIAAMALGEASRVVLARATATLRLALDRAGRPEWSWRDARSGEPLPPPVSLAGEPLAVLGRVLAAFGHASATPIRAGGSGFLGVLSHDLTQVCEPAVKSKKRAALPLIELHRVESCTVAHADATKPGAVGPAPAWAADPIRVRSQTGRLGYLARVRMCHDYIRCGDIYQANIGHRLTGPYRGSARSLFAALARHNHPKHGGYFEFAPDAGARAVLSMSPELFLEADGPTRRVTTRPMKGTRRAGLEDELRQSPKDRAELSMIVDLMRNDLGRVCEFGSVRVDEAQRIERHAADTLAQATATVSGTLREGLGIAELLAAAFPPGSVTGAPKVRALQLIDELEDFPRGVWCGSLAALGDDGSAELSVAIRTATLTAARIDYPVGAGIVADSDPVSEWRETLAKAEPLRPVAIIEDEE